MSDLIDRQALKAAHGLGTDCADCKRDARSCQYDRDFSRMDFCEWIDDAPTASPWHRVEEELPPKGFALIGARKRPPEISEDVWDMWVCEYDGEWGWQDMDGFALRGITHWMPIEPPKEEK